MNIKALIPFLLLSSCTLGPTIAYNPDGTPKLVTLGADVLTDADSDARQITIGNATLTWARNKPSQTSAVKTLGGAKILSGTTKSLDKGVTERVKIRSANPNFATPTVDAATGKVLTPTANFAP